MYPISRATVDRRGERERDTDCTTQSSIDYRSSTAPWSLLDTRQLSGCLSPGQIAIDTSHYVGISVRANDLKTYLIYLSRVISAPYLTKCDGSAVRATSLNPSGYWDQLSELIITYVTTWPLRWPHIYILSHSTSQYTAHTTDTEMSVSTWYLNKTTRLRLYSVRETSSLSCSNITCDNSLVQLF